MTEQQPPERFEAVAEAAGETVGEAKWTALRQLEQRFPGLDASQVEFTVLSEGERGLLGVGFVPARVVARVLAPPAPAQEAPQSPAGLAVRELLELVRVALGVEGSVAVGERSGQLTAVFHGRDLGLVIGKRGQTIDAIQHLAAALAARAAGAPAEVIVDAAGYRGRRRAALEALADRAAARVRASNKPVELAPMPASERKIIHLRLAARPGIATTSEGTEPNRYVVVRPAP